MTTTMTEIEGRRRRWIERNRREEEKQVDHRDVC